MKNNNSGGQNKAGSSNLKNNSPASKVSYNKMPSIPLTKPDSPSRSRKIFIILSLLLIVSLLAWTAKEYLPQDQNETEKTPTRQTSMPQELAPVHDQVKSAETLVREFFKNSSPDAHEALNLAKTLPKSSPADQDAVYRLYYFAVANHDLEAYLPYGDCLNPALPKWGTISKNAPEALDSYEKAARSNPEAAQRAVRELIAWLNQQAKSGNIQAEKWLKEIQK